MASHKTKKTTHHNLQLSSPELLCIVNILLSEQKRVQDQQRSNTTLNDIVETLPSGTTLLDLIKEDGEKL